MRRAFIPVIVICALFLGACGEAVSGLERPADETTTTTPAAAEGPPTLAILEGTWQCDVQRFAFADLSEQDEMLGERLAADGFTRGEYTAFKAELVNDAELRAEVKAAYDVSCPGDGDGVEGESVPLDEGDN